MVQQKKYRIHALLTCVNFTDYLEITIPHNRKIFESILIVTSKEDEVTQNFCDLYNINYIATDAFKPKFNKGAAINEGLTTLRSQRDVEWVMITDADILWPPSVTEWLPSLHPSYLYGCCRRVLLKSDLKDYFGKNVMPKRVKNMNPVFLGGNFEDMATFEDIKRQSPGQTKNYLKSNTSKKTNNPYKKIEAPEIFSARGCNSNVASTKEHPLPLGYGQLFNIKEYDHKYLERFTTAAGCDSYFSSLWPQKYRIFLQNFTVLHIGPRYIHWSGRDYRIM